jgi:hypothetical protein
MRKIAAGEAQVGDIIATPIMNEQGRTLLPKGARLSSAVLTRLAGWGVHELCIEGEQETAGVAEDQVDPEADADLLAALDDRFAAWEEDPTMMHIKSVAQRHLSTVNRGGQ